MLPQSHLIEFRKYTSIPTLRGDDNVIPPVSDLPHMLKSLAHPRRRSVSIGPQSAADAYETLAYRNRRRRESMNSLDGTVPEDSTWQSKNVEDNTLTLPQYSSHRAPLGADVLPKPMASRVHSYEQMMGTGKPNLSAITLPDHDGDFAGETAVQSPTEEENEKREIFMKLTKPRVRYDVEVVTKLIIYAGKKTVAFLYITTNSSRHWMVGCFREPNLVRIAWFGDG